MLSFEEKKLLKTHQKKMIIKQFLNSLANRPLEHIFARNPSRARFIVQIDFRRKSYLNELIAKFFMNNLL